MSIAVLFHRRRKERMTITQAYRFNLARGRFFYNELTTASRSYPQSFAKDCARLPALNYTRSLNRVKSLPIAELATAADTPFRASKLCYKFTTEEMQG